MFHEMLDSSWATTKMPLQAGTHYAPTQSWSITHRIISITGTQHALLDQIHDLFIESSLETISHMAGKFLVQVNRLLANRRIKRNRSLNCFRRGLCSTN